MKRKIIAAKGRTERFNVIREKHIRKREEREK